MGCGSDEVLLHHLGDNRDAGGDCEGSVVQHVDDRGDEQRLPELSGLPAALQVAEGEYHSRHTLHRNADEPPVPEREEEREADRERDGDEAPREDPSDDAERRAEYELLRQGCERKHERHGDEVEALIDGVRVAVEAPPVWHDVLVGERIHRGCVVESDAAHHVQNAGERSLNHESEGVGGRGVEPVEQCVH